MWTAPRIAAVVWNAGAVSLGGMALYYLMLARGTAARATANFYLVPGTAALLAWALLGEALSALTVAGLVGSSVGCWLVSRRERRCRGLAAARGRETSHLTANCVLPNMTSRSASVICPLRWCSASTATPRCTAGRAAIASCQRFTFG